MANKNGADKKIFIPTNVATILFCYFTGTLLSFPVGALEHQLFSFEAPEWTESIYGILYLIGFIGMIAWCIIFWRKYNDLAWGGVMVFLATLWLGLGLPALNSSR
jgi:hypothetical protein